ncbi:MAG TPA: serine hydrolase [Pirellulaceae bacterium]|nr:serine hydrolase [Pirellulaceae bacterium]
MNRCSPPWQVLLLVALGIVSAAPAAMAQQRDGESPFPTKGWTEKSPQELDLAEAKLREARDYALTGEGSGYITRHGYLVMKWGDRQQRYDLKSTTKSFGATALGVAILDGKIGLDDLAAKHHPGLGVPPEENRRTGWIDKITIGHLATQTAGFEKPGGYTKLVFEPGTKWLYSDGGPNWLAECVTLAYRRDVDELMFERIFTPLGITRRDLVWRKNSYREKQIDGIERREFGSGISASVDAMARVGYLYLRGGQWEGKRLLPADFVADAGRPQKLLAGLMEVDGDTHGNASEHYGYLWWNNGDGSLEKVPRDAYWSWGLYDSLIVVIPSLDIVVARAGKSWQRKPGADHYEVLRPFLEPIVAAAGSQESGDRGREPGARSRESGAAASDAPYPPSPVIKSIEWAPVETIIRRARGSDNWPITWGDDDQLYSAYGDGRGFEPFVPRKLSLGLVRIAGMPPEFRGENLRSETAEAIGDGATGRKASGLLMVDGTLYLLVRNAGNSQLGWSNDRGRTWSWADWKFTTSFGCPTFLQFGRDYAGARDESVYLYSQDSDSAYQRADRMVLARVPKGRLKEQAAYEFFVRLNENGEPSWTKDVEKRGAVFSDPKSCYRSGVSYCAGLKRYLWCQTGRGEDTRFRGGLAIYDAPQPWGPWTTVFFTDEWDVGPGETSSFPTKWMAGDGLSLHLVFSGDDCFSVRKAKLTVAP